MFFNVVERSLDLLESGARQLKRSPDENRLRLKLPPTFAMRWLIPRLFRFHALHPNIDVQITTSHTDADFDREDVDVSIYSWPEPPSGPNYRRVLGEILLPVCAPSLIRRGPPLREPAKIQLMLWLAESRRGMNAAIHREADPAATFYHAQMEAICPYPDANDLLDGLQKRAGFVRQWMQFFERYPVAITPVSAELPFPRPRSIESVRSDPEFNELFLEIWGLLRDDAMTAIGAAR